MKTHELKILQQYFRAVVDGSKKFELRKNDRDYQVGDCIFLNEYDGNNYTGNSLPVMITYILKGGQYGLEEGYCILGLKDIEAKTKQQFQLGDTAYMIDDDYKYFEGKVWQMQIEGSTGYAYRTDNADFDASDIGEWVFASELSREMHMQNLAESEE
jgi:uncharacterized protein YneR